jgi:hypothetical protein
MADFRDVLDFFAWYGYQFCPEMADYLHGYGMPGVAPALQDVLIRCPATETLYGEGALVPVMVDDLQPIRGLRTRNGAKVGEISPVSERLGFPVRIYNIGHPPLQTGKGRWECVAGDTRNSMAADLMVRVLEAGGVTTTIGATPCIIGDVLAVREDGQDLSIEEIVALCQEVRHLITLATKGDVKGVSELRNPKTFQETFKRQAQCPMGLANGKASELKAPYGTSDKRTTIPDAVIDPALISEASTPQSAATPSVAPGQVDNSSAPKKVLQSERTLSSLWAKVKARRGLGGLDGGILFEGYSFQTIDRAVSQNIQEGVAEGHEDMEVDCLEGIEYTTEAEDEEEPTSYEYPSPPLRRYTGSAEVMPEEEWEKLLLE